ncbi:hypothetical protein STCU_01325 [Strigomonas culicis]|nr:hypothetical protein STCU_01325 [Strigomonas culicis]|eukprot:EPY34777.1 hypothetical protein STCU_01325 [Strigomonas culicis]
MQTIAASTIISCGMTLIALIRAVARLRGHGSYGPVLLFAFLGFIWGLCANAMSISAYELRRCSNPRFSAIAHLDAGFALSLVAWVLLLVGFVLLAVATKFNVGPSLRQLRVMDTYFFVLVAVALLFTIIGNATTIWKRRFNTDDVSVVRVSYWHTELIMGNGTNIIFGRAMYRCNAYNKRIKASVSFLILGSIALTLSLITAVPAFFKRPCRAMACAFGIVASAFLLVSWVTAVAVKYRTLCEESVVGSLYADYPGVPSGIFNGATKFDTYGLQEGVILVILAWILVTAAVVFNFVVEWPHKRRMP